MKVYSCDELIDRLSSEAQAAVSSGGPPSHYGVVSFPDLTEVESEMFALQLSLQGKLDLERFQSNFMWLACSSKNCTRVCGH